MIADVWSKRDFAAAGIALAAVAVLALGALFDSSRLMTAAAIVAVIGMVVLIAWRLAGGPDERHHHDGTV
jgi:hypothetical protein